MELPGEGNVLMKAVREFDLEEVKRLLNSGELPQLINTKDKDGFTPLLRAMSPGNIPEDIMLKFIENSSVETLEMHYPTLRKNILHDLSYHGYSRAMKQVLNVTNKNVNMKNWRGQTPLHYCLKCPTTYEKHQEMAMCLITYGASCQIQDEKGKTPLDYYTENECSEYDKETRGKNKKELGDQILRLSVPAQIVARGEDAIKAFTEEIQQSKISGSCPRVMLLGKEGAGKTSCVKAILGKKLNDKEEPTQGIVSTTVFANGEDNSNWKEEIDADRSNLTKQMRDLGVASKILEKWNPSETESNEITVDSTQIPVYSHHAGKQDESAGIVAASKETREHLASETINVVSTKQLMTYGVREKVVSKLDKKDDLFNVTCVWDYAGQLPYCSAHKFFLTGGSSYSIVFSLLDILDELAKPRDPQKTTFEMTNLEMNLFWIRSVYEFAILPLEISPRSLQGRIASPPITLVGTHKDELVGSEAEKNKQIKGIFKKILEGVKDTPYEKHVDTEIYAVDNTNPSDEGIQKLKKNTLAYVKEMRTTVPISYVDFQIKVEELGKKIFHVSFDKISKIAVECGVLPHNVVHVLNYLHDLGVIYYSATNKKLKKTVITNIHILPEICAKIITETDEEVPVLMKEFHNLRDKGILAEDLLRHLWSKELGAKKEDNDDIFEVFIEFMKTFGLLFETKCPKQTRLFIVPSRMQVNPECLEVRKDDEQTASVYVIPNDFLPDANFNVIMVKFLEISQDHGCCNITKLFQNNAEIVLDGEHYLHLGRINIDNKQSIKLEIKTIIDKDKDDKNVVKKPNEKICMKILKFLRKQLDELYPSKDRVGYVLKILCPICCCTLRNLDYCLENDYITCNKDLSRMSRMSTASVQKLFKAPIELVMPVPGQESPVPECILQILIEKYKEIRTPILSFEVMADICTCLDFPNPLGNDWRALAAKLGYEARYIDFLTMQRNQTIWLLRAVCDEGWSVNDLKKFMAEIKRDDVVRIIDEYQNLTSK